jgi:prephenate dehydrogenase
MNQKISIIGTGLLGMSLALAVTQNFSDNNNSLFLWDPHLDSVSIKQLIMRVRQLSKNKKMKMKWITKFPDEITNSKYVLLCSPAATIVPLLKKIQPQFNQNMIVMDVASVKNHIVQQSEKNTLFINHFVPCHPMTGKEKSGFQWADSNLYKNKTIFITPLKGTPNSLIQQTANFWKKLKANPLIIDPLQHDAKVAWTSHLPHVLACLLVQLVKENVGSPQEIRKFIGSGFLDFTRIASGNPQIWKDIISMNYKNIQLTIRKYRVELMKLENKLNYPTSDSWEKFFQVSKKQREKLL